MRNSMWYVGIGLVALAGLVYVTGGGPDKPAAELGREPAPAVDAMSEQACEEPVRAAPNTLAVGVIDNCPSLGNDGRPAPVTALEVIDLAPALDAQPIKPATFEEPPIAGPVTDDGPGAGVWAVPGESRIIVVRGSVLPILDERNFDTMPYLDEETDLVFCPGTIMRLSLEVMEFFRTGRMPSCCDVNVVKDPSNTSPLVTDIVRMVGCCQGCYNSALHQLVESATRSQPSVDVKGRSKAAATEELSEEEQSAPPVKRVVPKLVSTEESGPKVDTMEIRRGDVRPMPFGPY
jgi:hypothetical protein